MRSRTNAPCSPTTTPGLSFLWLGLAAPSAYLVSTSTSFMDVDDRRKRQTSTATPAEPGDLPWVLGPNSLRPLHVKVDAVDQFIDMASQSLAQPKFALDPRRTKFELTSLG